MARPWIPTAHGLASLGAEFAAAAVKSPEVMAKVTQASAARIKADWREAWTRPAGSKIPNIHKSITYELTLTPFGIEAEIGSDITNKKNQGSIAHWIEYGTVNNAPMPGGGPALAKEAPLYEAALTAAMWRLL